MYADGLVSSREFTIEAAIVVQTPSIARVQRAHWIPSLTFVRDDKDASMLDNSQIPITRTDNYYRGKHVCAGSDFRAF